MGPCRYSTFSELPQGGIVEERVFRVCAVVVAPYLTKIRPLKVGAGPLLWILHLKIHFSISAQTKREKRKRKERKQSRRMKLSPAADRGARRTKKKVARTSKGGDRERGFGDSDEEVEWPLTPPSNHVWQDFLAQTDPRRQQVWQSSSSCAVRSSSAQCTVLIGAQLESGRRTRPRVATRTVRGALPSAAPGYTRGDDQSCVVRERRSLSCMCIQGSRCARNRAHWPGWRARARRRKTGCWPYGAGL
jgi:hypothetical protein